MSKWELVALFAGIYVVGAAASTAYLVARGIAGKPTFDGFTGTESEGGKAAEAILLWPVALPLAIVRGK